ncbi:hypothetical protein ACQKQD_12200 [Methylobacterium sp. NPDC080182]|uniref:hypothetical protein n=1 Tax=Methylobacterium sp. NPDC080182 TaxID=3390590 RepID=UPI003D08C150
MEKSVSTAVKKGLPSPAERPDLYDAFDGLQHAPEFKNPVSIPGRLQALMAERQAKAEPQKPVRKSRLRLIAKPLKAKAGKKTNRKGVIKTTTKRENRQKVAAAI